MVTGDWQEVNGARAQQGDEDSNLTADGTSRAGGCSRLRGKMTVMSMNQGHRRDVGEASLPPLVHSGPDSPGQIIEIHPDPSLG